MDTKKPAYTLALCSVIAALGAAVMLASGLIPVLTYCSPVVASLLLIPVLYEFGPGQGWMTWAVTAALAAILCTDKEAAFFYLFLGYYPILKPWFDKLGKPGFLLKLLYFAAVLAVMYALLVFLFGLEAVMSSPSITFAAVIYILLVGLMMVFDILLVRMKILYERRLRRVFFKKR